QLFPYDRLVQAPGQLLPDEAHQSADRASFASVLRSRATWAFAVSKALTDPVWWFYLFWLPKYLHERFAANMDRLGLPLVIVYLGATAGSIFGGWLAGFAIRRGCMPRAGRRIAMLVCALCATSVTLVPIVSSLSQAIVLLCLATTAHQAWSSNLLTTPSDVFPSHSGGAIGSVGSTLFTGLVGVLWSSHPLVIFFMAGLAYLTAWAAFQLRLPAMLGVTSSSVG
ncbi:MAG TPA: hypothetical protein VM912_07380, partial [Terriglobales bacterium]|nr:hypothetical protein [Terriglobales bacterium]